MRISRPQADHAKAARKPQRLVFGAEAGGGNSRADAFGDGLRSIGGHAGQPDAELLAAREGGQLATPVRLSV